MKILPNIILKENTSAGMFQSHNKTHPTRTTYLALKKHTF